MKLSNETVDAILHVIETFDRERGVPHDYRDLEVVLKKTEFGVSVTGQLVIAKEALGEAAPPSATTARPAHRDTQLDEGIEGRSMLLRAAREWLE